MDDQQRFQKDKSTVISIIKYIFYIAIIAGVLFASSKVLVIIMPFLIGFILAKASREISNAILKRRYRNRTRQEPKNPDQSEEAGVKSGKKNFFIRSSGCFYFLENEEVHVNTHKAFCRNLCFSVDPRHCLSCRIRFSACRSGEKCC